MRRFFGRFLFPSAAIPALFCCFALFSGCSTLPLPDTPDESLLIFAYDIADTWQHGNITVKSVDVYLENADTGEKRTVSLLPGVHYKAVALEPGAYVTKKLVVVNQWQNDVNSIWYDDHHYFKSLYLTPQTVYLYSDMINFSAREGMDGYNLFHIRAVEKKRNAVLEDLREDDHWPAWEDYYLYGFEYGG